MTAETQLLIRAYDAALACVRERVDGEVARHVEAAATVLGPSGEVLLVAFGKAARPMAERAVRALAPLAVRVRGLLVPPNDDSAPLPPLEVIPGGHPLPTEGSFAAGRRALELAAGAGPEDAVVFLVSGGGSALLELPIDDAASVVDWRRLQQALVGSGASIERVNAVRMRLSAIKGGRLGAAAARAKVSRTLVISDVPGDIETVASGPTARCGARPDTLCEDIEALQLERALPDSVAAMLRTGAVPGLPRDDAVPGELVTIADEHHARARAAAVLAAAGVHVDDALDIDDAPYERAVDEALARLEQLARRHPGEAVAVVTTGELSVPLRGAVGTGGRNLQFALRCAEQIEGSEVTALSCGTDGVDGTAPAAGAVVDGHTATRARAEGFDVPAHLRLRDAYPLLKQLGCTVEPGPTGVNVRDLRILLRRG